MITLQLRRLFLAVLVTMVAFGTSPAAADEPTITFYGGGFGHGIGMSQYGALGRAQAGHTYDEILDFYYPNTAIGTAGGFGVDDVDVLLEKRSMVAISRPWTGGAPQPGWKVEITADGGFSATATEPVTATQTGGVWSATVRDRDENGEVILDGNGDPVLIELCNASCSGVLSFRVIGGTHAVVEQSEGGTNVGMPRGGTVAGAYAGGKIVLRPSTLGGGCGTGTTFCVIHAGVDLEQYLRGIAEIPTSWPVEAQKAQAVAARSYAASAIIRRAGNGTAWDVENSTNDQYYVGYGVELDGCGNWCNGVTGTAGEVVVHGGAIAETFYSASNGGATAEPPDVWASGTTRPYLVARPDSFDGNDANPYAPREVVYSVSDVSRWLNEYHLSYPSVGDQLQVGTVRNIRIDDVPASGRVNFATVTIVGTEKTVVVDRDGDGSGDDPYGERFYNALKVGCQATPGCDPLRSSNFQLRDIMPFADVRFGDFFYEPVQWMTTEGITTGLSPTNFGAGVSNTRAQLATFIWRFAGEPAPTEPHGFGDLVTGSFYEDAVAWMKETGITTGTSPGRFSPEGTVTRGQAAAFLWRFAGSPESSASLSFTDVPSGRYYTDAVRWMVEWGITTGTTPTTFSPDALLTRAQIATFLWRLAAAPDAFADGVELPLAMR
ncbi:MAG: SpoIID/LytB domain-containing protein [Acidimicrobiales bacterium]